MNTKELKALKNQFKRTFFQNSFLRYISDNRNLRCLKVTNLGVLGQDLDVTTAFYRTHAVVAETLRRAVAFRARLRESESYALHELLDHPDKRIQALVLSPKDTQAVQVGSKSRYLWVSRPWPKYPVYLPFRFLEPKEGPITQQGLLGYADHKNLISLYGQDLIVQDDPHEHLWSYAIVRSATDTPTKPLSVAWKWVEDPTEPLNLKLGITADLNFKFYEAVPVSFSLAPNQYTRETPIEVQAG